MRTGALLLIVAAIVAGVLAFGGSAPAPSQTPRPVAAKLIPRGSVAVFNARGRSAPLRVPVSGPATPGRVARAYLERARPAASRHLVRGRTQRMASGDTVVRFEERHDGVPVIGGEAVVVVDDRGRVVAASSEVLPDAPPATTPRLSAAQARARALESVARESGRAGLVASGGALALYDPRLVSARGIGRTALVWDVQVRRPGLARRVLVDAGDGAVALDLEANRAALSRKVCDAASTATKVPCTAPVRTEGGPASGVADVNAAYDFAGDTYDFYAGLGRNSIDDAGMPIVSTVRYCPTVQECPYGNAYWDGTQMVYGEGFAVDDVVAHELTHGVTDHTSRLFYYAQSGAINESLSDIFGELVDLGNGAGTDTPAVRWQIGEDIAGGALRDMADPTTFGDPDSTASPDYSADTAETDSGGVHTNSNVSNKAAYLVTDGDTFNGVTVGGIGTAKSAKVFYAAAQLLRSGSDFRDLADALDQACAALQTSAAVTAADCTDVSAATQATAMRQVPVKAPVTTAPVCGPGEAASDVYNDTFASGPAAGWTRTTASGTNGWYWANETNPFDFDAHYSPAGDGNLWGDDPSTTSDSAIAMTTSVTVPATGAHMRFRHAYGFDDNTSGVSRRYDGGVLEYSTNGGSTWVDAGPLMTEGGYTSTISTGQGNPLGGRSAFVRESNGYGVTRLDLSSLAGQQIRFRFRIGSGPSVGDYGWFIDDLRVYRCRVPDLTPPQTTIDSGPSGATADATPTFTFSASEPASTFECRIDAAAFSACVSPLTTTTLADGPHTLEVRATDDSGNTDQTPAARAFSVDTTPPDTTLGTAPPALTNDTTPTVTFSSPEVGATFQCRVDAGAWNACVSPFTTAPLADGPHTIAVRALDALGNVDATPASAAVTIDATAPQTTIGQGPDPVTTDATPAFGFTSSEPGSTFECQVDAGSWDPCTSPFTSAALADGPHTFAVRATDPAGNADATPASKSFTVDTTTPDTTPPDTTIDVAPPALAGTATPSVAFSASEVGATFECRVDAGPWTTCTSPFATPALADGPHTIEVRALDVFANADQTPASAAVTVDTTAPETVIDAEPPAVAALRTPAFAFSSPDAGATFACSIDEGPWSPCASPFTAPALVDGDHAFAVRASDAVGNTDATPATSAFRIEQPPAPPVEGTLAGTPPAPPAGPGTGTTPPAAVATPFTLTAGLPRVVRSRSGVRVAVRLRCSQPCRSRVQIRVPVRLARTLRLRGSRVGTQVVVASSRLPARTSASRLVTVRLPRALVRRRAVTVLTVTASARTVAGRTATTAAGRVRLAPSARR